MPTKTKNLPTVKECIAYVESLGYNFDSFIKGSGYFFRIKRPETRPPHNWEMTWTLGEMRDAIKNGC
jgi:hypothetical protein